MSGHGGKRAGAGRKKGSFASRLTLEKVAELLKLQTFSGVEELAAAARASAPMNTLIRILLTGKCQRARVCAAKEIIARAYPVSRADWSIAEARQYARIAIATLQRISQSADDEIARVEACNVLLISCVPPG